MDTWDTATRTWTAAARVCRRLSVWSVSFALLAMTALPAICLADGPLLAGACFLENVGQYDAKARYAVYGGDSVRWLTSDGLWLVADDGDGHGQAVKLCFVGANDDVDIEPIGRLATRVSFFKGNDPELWRTDVPVWREVRYVDLYPGIDLVMKGSQSGWAWAIETNARLSGVDRTQAMAQVQLRAEGGDLVATKEGWAVHTGMGTIALPAFSTSRVASEPALATLDNPSHLAYATYLGGIGEEAAEEIVVDDDGCVHLVGWTSSTDFPATPGAYDTGLGGDRDAMVFKLSADGTSLIYATFLGGSGTDRGYGISLDSEGNAYLVGMTASADMPTTEGVLGQTDRPGDDAFCAKLGPMGNTLDYCTYLGADGDDVALAIAVDSSGATYLTGHTTSESDPDTPEGFPIVPGSYVQARTGIMAGENVFVCKLSPRAITMTYSLVLGTPGLEQGTDVVVDSSGRATVLGWTNHLSFTTTAGDFGNSYGGSLYDVFCMRFSADGSDLEYSRLIGGSGWDEPGDLAIDLVGSAYVSGWTGSRDFPVTPGAFQTAWLTEQIGEEIVEDNKAAFVVKLNPTGTSLVFGTLMGGMGIDQAHGLAIDGAGTVYVSGDTTSADLSTTPDGLDTTYNGAQSWGGDAFLCALDPMGRTLTYGTYLGGSDADARAVLAISSSGNLYMAGRTLSHDLPVTSGAYRETISAGLAGDIFVAQLGPQAEPIQWRLAVPIVMAR